MWTCRLCVQCVNVGACIPACVQRCGCVLLYAVVHLCVTMCVLMCVPEEQVCGGIEVCACMFESRVHICAWMCFQRGPGGDSLAQPMCLDMEWDTHALDKEFRASAWGRR